jgi:hypothetical protein
LVPPDISAERLAVVVDKEGVLPMNPEILYLFIIPAVAGSRYFFSEIDLSLQRGIAVLISHHLLALPSHR